MISDAMELLDLHKTQMLFDTTPENKMFVFERPSLWLLSGNKVIKRWENTQPFYFYPFSVLDFLNGCGHRELRIIASGKRISKEAILNSNGSKVHFEMVDTELMDYALLHKCKVSAICDIEQISEFEHKILSRLDMLIVRVNSPENNLSALRGIPNKKLLSGIRVYLSEENNDFHKLAEQARSLGIDFIHVSKKLVGVKQVHLNAKFADDVRKLKDLETKFFRVLLPTNLMNVYNEKFEISNRFGNSRSCAFSQYRVVLFQDRFYPCYTKSIINSGTFSFDSVEAMHNNAKLFGKTCSDCACIYENDLFEDIHRTSDGLKEKKFLLGYNSNKYTS
ncbi:MAG: hypothetical protein QXL94_05515 [Candidatus Parvarchaeum sp.]